MPLNKVKRGSQMYPWCSHTLTILNGDCPHGCRYCYVNDLKRYPVLAEKYSGLPRLVESDLQLNLGSGKTIFVCSTGDLFAEGVPSPLIERVLELLRKYPDNTYLFQSKNPGGFLEYDFDGLDAIFGTTIESNRDYGITLAPKSWHRAYEMSLVVGRKTVSVEPIMDFDLGTLVGYIKSIGPEFVSIGADSKGHSLPEPTAEKVKSLIMELKAITEVRLKSNLARLGIAIDEQAVDFFGVA